MEPLVLHDLDDNGSPCHYIIPTLRNPIHFHLHPRSGLWFITFERGMVPQKLSGYFTSLKYLREKVNVYLKSKKK